MKTYDIDPIVVSPSESNITDLLVDRFKATPKLPLFAIDKGDGQWLDISTEEFYHQVVALAKGLIASGIQPGQAVAIMSRTRYEWSLVDFAIWFAGAISVPIYESSSPTQMHWILSDSDSVAVFLETAAHQDRFEAIKSSVPLARQVWRLDQDSIEQLIQRGHDILIIDEALAVGDQEFRNRSEARMREMRENAGTVFLVSHSMKSIIDTCTRVIWIEKGELRMDGDPKKVTAAYNKFVGSTTID